MFVMQVQLFGGRISAFSIFEVARFRVHVDSRSVKKDVLFNQDTGALFSVPR